MGGIFGSRDFGGEKIVWPSLFSPRAHHFSTPQIGEKIGRRKGLIEITHLPMKLTRSQQSNYPWVFLVWFILRVGLRP